MRVGGGGGGIRTHGTLSRTPVFKTGAFDHSATPPVAQSYCLKIDSKTAKLNLTVRGISPMAIVAL